MKWQDFLTGVKEIKVTGPSIIFQFDIFGFTINITESVVIGWILIALITAFVLYLTHDLKTQAVTKRQVIAEMLVNTVQNLVRDTMGKRYLSFAPYVATIFVFSATGSLVSLLGLRSMTADFNVTFCWGMMTFIMITATKLKTSGPLGYAKGFFEPFPVMFPLNVISEVATPISMGFRHFGNIAGGMIITSLLYFALTAASTAIGLAFPALTIGIPAVLSVYFDLFTGFMQGFIFIMLTMAYIESAGPPEEEA